MILAYSVACVLTEGNVTFLIARSSVYTGDSLLLRCLQWHHPCGPVARDRRRAADAERAIRPLQRLRVAHYSRLGAIRDGLGGASHAQAAARADPCHGWRCWRGTSSCARS